MTDDDMFAAVRDCLSAARDRVAGEQIARPAGAIISRARRRRLQQALTTTTAAVIVAVAAFALLLPGSRDNDTAPVRLAAWTVTTKPGGLVGVTIRELRDPAGLQRQLRADGVRATVQFDVYLSRDHGHIFIPAVTPCYYPLPNLSYDLRLMPRIFPRSTGRSGQILFVINPSAIPAGTELWIGAIRPLRYGFLGRADATLIYPSGHCPSRKPTRFAYVTELPLPTGKMIIIHEK